MHCLQIIKQFHIYRNMPNWLKEQNVHTDVNLIIWIFTHLSSKYSTERKLFLICYSYIVEIVQYTLKKEIKIYKSIKTY